MALKSSPCLFHRVVLPDMSSGIEYLPDISECISDGNELYIFYTNDKGNEVEGRFRPEGLKRSITAGICSGTETDQSSVPFLLMH